MVSQSYGGVVLAVSIRSLVFETILCGGKNVCYKKIELFV